MHGYVNGNYNVLIDSDTGTKIRYNNSDKLIPDYAESCDVNITTVCDNGCDFCYAGCSTSGTHADLKKHHYLFKYAHPFTEVALNGNDLTHPELNNFLKYLKDHRIFANLTVNQRHFMMHYDKLKRLSLLGLIKGLGVSLQSPDKDFIRKYKKYPRAIIHVIAGLITPEELMKLPDNSKILILGYKNKGRGIQYYNQNSESIKANILDLERSLPKIFDKFDVVSFDNLGIEQLNIDKHLSKEEFDKVYMGSDGTATFYLDLVNGYFAKDSMSDKHFNIEPNQSLDDMFNTVRKYYNIVSIN